jgi:transcriptional regulator with XRE-family HTH domain
VAETFSERLARLRSERQMSVSELARAVRLSEGAIRNLERGVTRGPSVFVAFRLARALGVSVSYLAFGTEGEPEETESHWRAAVVEVQEHQALEIAALNRRVSSLEAQAAADRPRTAPE